MGLFKIFRELLSGNKVVDEEGKDFKDLGTSGYKVVDNKTNKVLYKGQYKDCMQRADAESRNGRSVSVESR